jgi:quinol monooxygenase YgiN
MAYALLVELPNLTREEYEAVAKAVNSSGYHVPGNLVHAAGPFAGGYRVVEVFESKEAADAFYSSQRFRDACATVYGETMPDMNIISTWEIVGLDQGSGWRSVA